MPARRSRLHPARLVAIFMAVLSLAVAILWVDSYRERTGPHLAAEQKEWIKRILGDDFDLPASKIMIGLDWEFIVGDPRAIRMRTCDGSVALQFASNMKTGARLQEVAKSWRGFGYLQTEESMSISWLRNNENRVIFDQKARSVSFPIWALFLLCAAYPTIYVIRGPLRRRKRRRRGQCLDCGYDLRGSADQCPECGAQVIGPRGSCAARVAGSSHAVIDGENAPSG